MMPLPALALSVLGSRLGQIAAAAVVAFGAGFWAGYDTADDAAEIDRLTATIEALERTAALEEVGREVAEARADRAEAEAATYRERIERLEEWTDEMDGPVGDGLRDVLRGLQP